MTDATLAYDYKPDGSELLSWLSLQDETETAELFRKAREVRDKFCGNDIFLRGLIEVSNICVRSCMYCGLRWENKKLERYIMSPNEVQEAVDLVIKSGLKTVVMQSGENPYIPAEEIYNTIIAIKESGDIAVTLSLGERDFWEYDLWKEAGADRYLLKHETANPVLYKKIHQGENLENRLDHLRYLKKAGYQIGTGNIVGLPGQKPEDILEDIYLAEELQADMVSVSPFIPSKETPFANVPLADLGLTLRTIAATRIYLKDVHMPATTALGTLTEGGREMGLDAGANVIMPSFTPHGYKANYSIYDNKICINEHPAHCINCITLRMAAQGYRASSERGDSPKSKNSTG